ncbi:hypothetical protein H4Q26_000558 [Puccinia striiformis f. sp. tritici PST-130]|nr:hypothetical protein H4Q26_000558 [Puccinia striiformis f. sp. tritici PST-130]
MSAWEGLWDTLEETITMQVGPDPDSDDEVGRGKRDGDSESEQDSHDEADLKTVQPTGAKRVNWGKSRRSAVMQRLLLQDSKQVQPCFTATLGKKWTSENRLKLEKTECGTEEDEMLLLKAKARSLDYVHKIFATRKSFSSELGRGRVLIGYGFGFGSGRTQIAAGSRTVLGIGPGPVGLINQLSP